MASPRRKVLFLTNSDYGQANVILATAHAMMHIAPDTEIHIASFAGLENGVRYTSEFALRTARTASPLIFHLIKGISNWSAQERPEVGVMESFARGPGFINSSKGILMIPAIMQPWTTEEFVGLYHEAKRVYDEVQPDITVVEPLFTPGMTLCHHIGTNWIVLAPNTIKDFAVPLQPWLAMMWKYPLIFSAFPFPLPWHLIPSNIFFNLVAGYALVTDTRIKNTVSYMRQHIAPSINLMTANELGVLKAPPPGLRVLVSNARDLDYPFDVLPEHVIPCGPIVRAAPAVADVDRELAAWLARGPTIYVNLGTHLQMDVSQAVEMALAFRDLLDKAQDVDYGGKGGAKLQILWKLRRKTPHGEHASDPNDYSGLWKLVQDALRSEFESDRVRITSWITAEPKSILESGRVICSVNHGGASSFNESICAGIPQVLLPAWSDCFDYGNRVELLKVGRWANKVAKPSWKRNELASALEEVILSDKAAAILEQVKRLSKNYPEGAGRNYAAKEILSAIQS